MAVREIIKFPDKRLRLISEPVKRIDAGIRKLVEDMFETQYHAPRVIGLAAIQVGVAKRVVTVDLSKKEEAHEPRVFINPEITWTSEEKIT
jgi:peptide deformylase